MKMKKVYFSPECFLVELEALSLCDPSGGVEPGGNEDIGYEDWG